MSEYQFTQDWFSHNIPVWEQLATDFFVNTFAESLDIVHIGHQFAVRKK